MMLLYPSIDLMNGSVVRLERGLAEKKTVYSTDPIQIAKQWENRGGDWLHIVNLDGAFGIKSDKSIVKEIVHSVSIPSQLGGGMRDMHDIEWALSIGVKRVVIGTKAVDISFLKRVICEFGAENFAVGIDTKNEKVAINGWVDTLEMSVFDLINQVLDQGIKTLICTDIATDGMMQGPNFTFFNKLTKTSVSMNLIASGGISSPEDIKKLSQIAGIGGIIIGRALYENKMPQNLKSLLTEIH